MRGALGDAHATRVLPRRRAGVWLDLANERLWCGDQVQVLGPKPSPSSGIWWNTRASYSPKRPCSRPRPETTVSEVALSVCIRELRQALGDDARRPRCIETVHRRGYRFMGHLPTVHPSAPPPSSPPHRALPPLLPGRAAELEALQHGLATALTGARQLLFVTGAKRGSGKRRWSMCSSPPQRAMVRCGSGAGSASTTTGRGEAYLPILEAVERLCRGPGGPEIVEIPATAGTHLVGADAWTGASCGAGGTAAPGAGHHPGAHAAGDGRGPQRRWRRPSRSCWCSKTCTGVIMPPWTCSRRWHADSEPARFLLLGTYRPPRCAAAGPSAADGHARAAACTGSVQSCR